MTLTRWKQGNYPVITINNFNEATYDAVQNGFIKHVILIFSAINTKIVNDRSYPTTPLFPWPKVKNLLKDIPIWLGCVMMYNICVVGTNIWNSKSGIIARSLKIQESWILLCWYHAGIHQDTKIMPFISLHFTFDKALQLLIGW